MLIKYVTACNQHLPQFLLSALHTRSYAIVEEAYSCIYSTFMLSAFACTRMQQIVQEMRGHCYTDTHKYFTLLFVATLFLYSLLLCGLTLSLGAPPLHIGFMVD